MINKYNIKNHIYKNNSNSEYKPDFTAPSLLQICMSFLYGTSELLGGVNDDWNE